MINPGSTSTKLGIWEEGKGVVLEHNVPHSREELAPFNTIAQQQPYRTRCVEEFLSGKGYNLEDFTALAPRGGLLQPLAGGTYAVNEHMVDHLEEGVQGEHASNLAALIAWELGRKANIPAYITDPVSVDEFHPPARYSGIPEIPRRSLGHALNIKATARQACEEMGKGIEESHFVVAHLGGGISIAALEKGRIVDVNNANEMGPYSPERSGGLPVGDVVKMAMSGSYTMAEMRSKITRQGGLLAYLHTNDCAEIEKRISKGDEEARLVYDGMIYQIAKEIGASAAVLSGTVDAILITGGIAQSQYIVDSLRDRVEFIAPVKIFPGSMEMEALALGAYRVLKGEERAQIYKPKGYQEVD